jgi:protein tyrosine phosphatase (PTP) superfamily phosphohydrolase (DUF442 family)
MKRSRKPWLVLAVIVALTAACSDPSGEVAEVPPPIAPGAPGYDLAAETALPETAPQEWDDLHNLYRLSENVISGGEPLGEGALERLAEMGVKTILSVDGKTPDVATAEKLGMRYVHVPIQYKGITAEERARIAKTFRELPGPFFVHCFHGKHRGPAAAAIGRIVLDGAPRERALAEMRQWCGTSPKYGGLYETIARSEIPAASETAALDWDFPAEHRFDGFRQTMVELTRAWDLLVAAAKRGFRPDPEHPDVDARNEAAKLRDMFLAGEGFAAEDGRPEDFLVWMRESTTAARELHEAMAHAVEGDVDATAEAKAALDALKQGCGSCHNVYRND